MIDWAPIWLTLKLALCTTIVLWMISIPLAYWLASAKSRIKPILETLISMPLVLPPTVIGFYLLILFSPTGWLGSWIEQVLGIRLVFSFPGLVIASVVYSLPFMVNPFYAGFKNIPTQLLEMSAVLGKSKWQTLWKVQLPNMKPSLLSGSVLAFAHTIGEFGVVLMIGGNIPNKTRVASIAIYDEVEALNYAHANLYSLILFILAFAILLMVYSVNSGMIYPFAGIRKPRK